MRIQRLVFEILQSAVSWRASSASSLFVEVCLKLVVRARRSDCCVFCVRSSLSTFREFLINFLQTKRYAADLACLAGLRDFKHVFFKTFRLNHSKLQTISISGLYLFQGDSRELTITISTSSAVLWKIKKTTWFCRYVFSDICEIGRFPFGNK